jgi:CheY-like chemotaxis protein
LTAAHLLVVDDNEVNLELARFVLAAEGFEVATAIDAKQALERIAQRAPTLILMDIQLPGMDGLTLTRRLKADPATRPIVVVAFTAYAMAGDEARMLAAGCDGYISKPIELASFARRVRGFLPVADGPAMPH